MHILCEVIGNGLGIWRREKRFVKIAALADRAFIREIPVWQFRGQPLSCVVMRTAFIMCCY